MPSTTIRLRSYRDVSVTARLTDLQITPKLPTCAHALATRDHGSSPSRAAISP